MNNIHLDTEMTTDEMEYVRNRLFQYNQEKAQSNQAAPMNLVLKDAEGKIYGGLIGKIYRSCLGIEILWVDEELRGSGYGKKLLDQAEASAISGGCKFIHLDTFSFQAPEFYKKNGYVIFGVLEGYPDGAKRYYLKKDL